MAVISAPVRERDAGIVPLPRERLRQLLWPDSGALSPLPALDGLRALAVLLVLLFHAWLHVPGYLSPGEVERDHPIAYGSTGVHLFFVLSGFLLFLPYARWLFGLQGRPSTLLFYKRRILRVCPAYWVSIVLLSLPLPLTPAVVADALVHAVFLSNLTPDTVYTINSVFWTMAIEVQFYALLPWIGLALWWLARRFGLPAAVALGLVALAASSGLNVLLDGRPGLEALPFSTALVSQVSVGRWLGVFAGGIFSSFCYVYVLQVAPAHLRDSLYLRPTATLLPAAGVALALGIAFLPALRAMPLKPLFFGAAYTLLLLGVLFGTPSLRRPFEGRVTRFIGLISYSFYIWHWVLMEALIPKELPPLGIELVVALRFLIGLGLAALVAYISYQLCERPFLRARRRAREAPAA